MCVLSALDCCLLFCFNYYYCLLTVTLGSGGQAISATPGEQLGAEKPPFSPLFGGMLWSGIPGHGEKQRLRGRRRRRRGGRRIGGTFSSPAPSWLPPVTSMGTFRPPPLPRFVCLFVLLKLFCAFNKTALKNNNNKKMARSLVAATFSHQEEVYL